MASTTNKQKYSVCDLATRAVTLFPNRAQVVRELKAVPLKPGANEIVIVGLTPTVDEKSIKVEGTGAATITDISCELLRNRDIFQEVHPDSDADSDDDKKDDDDDGDDGAEEASQNDRQALKVVLEKLTLLRDEQRSVKEKISSANRQLEILNSFGSSLVNPMVATRPSIEGGLATYREQRAIVYISHTDATKRSDRLDKEISDLVKVEARLRRRALRSKTKEKEQTLRRKAEKQREKDRIRKEHEKFWPKYCYTVRISLDVPAAAHTQTLTPASSSRRSSIASDSDMVNVVAEEEPTRAADDSPVAITCDLALSYLTESAFWAPIYDIELSTTSNTGNLCFDSGLTNTTSEVWQNCKIVLSTSQTIFTGLQDADLTLKPWHVQLTPKDPAFSSDITTCVEERFRENGFALFPAGSAQKSRAKLFGVDRHDDLNKSVGNPGPPAECRPLFPCTGTKLAVGGNAASLFGPEPANRSGGGLFGNFGNGAFVVPQSSSLFGNAPSAANRPTAVPVANPDMWRTNRGDSVTQQQQQQRPQFQFGSGQNHDNDNEDVQLSDFEPEPELAFQETAFEETGLTTTYELPGFKTLRPASTPSRQRITRVSFSDVVFSHTVVPKNARAAYLHARLRNTSHVTLPRGPVGITLDKTFLGRATLPRLAGADDGGEGGGSFKLGLGVDPAIGVSYARPALQRNMAGLFTKVESSVYVRAVTLTNSRRGAGGAGRAAKITVIDQVPVSRDENLHIAVLQPRGLIVDGAGVPTGTGVSRGSKGDQGQWGQALAVLKKEGEVAWDVTLNARKSVKLTLEYEVAAPSKDMVVECNSCC